MNRCPICNPACRLILGSGPEPCDYLFIGEKPGREEDARGKVFVGDTGRELDATYLGLSGLDRPGIRITNSLKCRLGGNNNKPTTEQVRACAGHWLPEEVNRCRPRILVLLGATACSLVPKIELTKDNGYPLWIGRQDSEFFGGWEGWVVPMYHPAAGLHETAKMIPLLDDFERMGKWLRGKWEQPKPLGLPKTEYRVIRDLGELQKELSHEFYEYIPVDTERDGPNKPWSIQFSTYPGRARLIPADRKDLLERFSLLVTWGFRGYMLHNAGQDLDMIEAIGLPTLPVRDTMQEAYQIGNLPQGLKALGWRLCGVRMRSWRDVVMPYSRRKMVEWLTEQWDEASDNRERVEKQLKTKVKVEWKPSKLERDLKRILSHAEKPEYDLWEKAQEIRLSGYPVPSIAHVPREEAVEYACQDADVTGQVGMKLEEIRKGLVEKEWGVLEEDWDQ